MVAGCARVFVQVWAPAVPMRLVSGSCPRSPMRIVSKVAAPHTCSAILSDYLVALAAAARALADVPELGSEDIARRAMNVAADMCVYTNHEFIVESLANTPDSSEEDTAGKPTEEEERSPAP